MKSSGAGGARGKGQGAALHDYSTRSPPDSTEMGRIYLSSTPYLSGARDDEVQWSTSPRVRNDPVASRGAVCPAQLSGRAQRGGTFRRRVSRSWDSTLVLFQRPTLRRTLGPRPSTGARRAPTADPRASGGRPWHAAPGRDDATAGHRATKLADPRGSSNGDPAEALHKMSPSEAEPEPPPCFCAACFCTARDADAGTRSRAQRAR